MDKENCEHVWDFVTDTCRDCGMRREDFYDNARKEIRQQIVSELIEKGAVLPEGFDVNS